MVTVTAKISHRKNHHGKRMRGASFWRNRGMRKRRHLVAGAYYHVCARVNRKEFLLQSAVAKDMLVQTLASCIKKYAFTVENFAIMENHVHLLLHPLKAEDLPLIMRWLLGMYTKRYNARFKTCGCLWGDRYYSRTIQTPGDLLSAHRYIDQNPVRAKLVDWASDWPWCTCYHHARGLQSIVQFLPEWLLVELPDHRQRSLSLSGNKPSFCAILREPGRVR